MTGGAQGPEEFGKRFLDTALRTVRLVRIFEDGDMSLRPGPGSMSTAEQINHICASHNFLRGLLEDDQPTPELFSRQYDVSSAAAAARSLGTAIEEVRQALGRVTAARWNEVVEPFGPDWRMSRGELAHVMVDHEIHHRGALHVYARVAGKVPPVLYRPLEA